MLYLGRNFNIVAHQLLWASSEIFKSLSQGYDMMASVAIRWRVFTTSSSIETVFYLGCGIHGPLAAASSSVAQQLSSWSRALQCRRRPAHRRSAWPIIAHRPRSLPFNIWWNLYLNSFVFVCSFVGCSFAIFRYFCSYLGLYDRDYYVINEAVSRGVACFTVIGGGYGKDIQILSKRHTLVHRAAVKASVKLIAS